MRIYWSDWNPFKKKYKAVFCLNGGSSRTMAYLGAYDFLRSQGVQPVGFVAKSAGCFIPIIDALGVSSTKVRQRLKQFVLKDHLRGAHIPLVNQESFREFFRAFMPSRELSRFRPNIYLAAIELESNRLEYLHQGVQSIEAMMATCAIPGVIGPYSIESKRYFDGGFMDGTDVAFAKRTFPGHKVIELGLKKPILQYLLEEAVTKAVSLLEGGIASEDPRDVEPDYRLEFTGLSGSAFSIDEIDDNYTSGYNAAKEAWPEIKQVLESN